MNETLRLTIVDENDAMLTPDHALDASVDGEPLIFTALA